MTNVGFEADGDKSNTDAGKPNTNPLSVGERMELELKQRGPLPSSVASRVPAGCLTVERQGAWQGESDADGEHEAARSKPVTIVLSVKSVEGAKPDDKVGCWGCCRVCPRNGVWHMHGYKISFLVFAVFAGIGLGLHLAGVLTNESSDVTAKHRGHSQQSQGMAPSAPNASTAPTAAPSIEPTAPAPPSPTMPPRVQPSVDEEPAFCKYAETGLADGYASEVDPVVTRMVAMISIEEQRAVANNATLALQIESEFNGTNMTVAYERALVARRSAVQNCAWNNQDCAAVIALDTEYNNIFMQIGAKLHDVSGEATDSFQDAADLARDLQRLEATVLDEVPPEARVAYSVLSTANDKRKKLKQLSTYAGRVKAAKAEVMDMAMQWLSEMTGALIYLADPPDDSLWDRVSPSGYGIDSLWEPRGCG